MSKIMDLSIPFTSDTIATCLCSKCPVERNSKCAKDQLSKVGQTVCGTKPLNREEIPAAYCTAGIASCSDLDTSKECICATCKIFAKYGLEERMPESYFCHDGKAM